MFFWSVRTPRWPLLLLLLVLFLLLFLLLFFLCKVCIAANILTRLGWPQRGHCCGRQLFLTNVFPPSPIVPCLADKDLLVSNSWWNVCTRQKIVRSPVGQDFWFQQPLWITTGAHKTHATIIKWQQVPTSLDILVRLNRCRLFFSQLVKPRSGMTDYAGKLVMHDLKNWLNSHQQLNWPQV